MARRPRKTPLKVLRDIVRAEGRAYAHAADLQADGVNTNPVFPKKPQDLTNESAARKYLKRLNKFNSTDYVAGREGSPLDRSLYDTYMKTFQVQRQYYRVTQEFANRTPYITGGRPSDMTLQEYPMTDKAFHDRMVKDSVPDIEGIRSNADLKRRIKALNSMMKPGYMTNYTDQMRKILDDTISYWNSPELEQALEGLSESQMFALLKYTDFMDQYRTWLNTDRDNDLGPYEDWLDHDQYVDTLMKDIAFARNAVVEYGPSWLPVDPYQPDPNDNSALRTLKGLARRAQEGVLKVKRKFNRKRGRRR